MKVFLDTNIILDLLLQREGWEDSASVIQLQETGELQACVSVLTMLNSAYVYRKTVGNNMAVVNLKYLSALFEVLPMDAAMLDDAVFTSGRDFEDVFQAVCAARAGCTAIVTNHVKDFQFKIPEEIISRGLSIPPVITPSALLASLH